MVYVSILKAINEANQLLDTNILSSYLKNILSQYQMFFESVHGFYMSGN